MANFHFKYLSNRLTELRHEGYLLDSQLSTQQNPVSLHKVILAVFSSNIRQSNKTKTGQWQVAASGYTESDIENLIEFLYDGDIEICSKISEIIHSLKLDLSVDQKIRKKKISKHESIQHVVNLELKYLRNLVFEMEIPKLLNDHKSCMDVTIRIGCKSFFCHKIILAAMSPFFQVMFTSGMKEESEEEIVVKGIESDIFSVVLNYIYTGKNGLNVSNAQDLLSAAVYLQVTSLQNQCEEYLITQMDSSNCVNIWTFADAYNCQLLAKEVWIFIVENFNVINRLGLQSLHFEDIKRLLQDDSLNINNEKEVLRFTFDWVSKNQQPEKLPQLLLYVRLILVDKVFLEEILNNHKLVKNNEECQKLIENALAEKISGTAEGKFPCNPRKEKVFVVISRSSRESDVEVGCLSLSQRKWFMLEPNTICKGGTGYSACANVDSIFMTGGTSDPYSFFKFSITENKWTQLPNMNTGRHSHATGYVDGAVYVLGGSGISWEVFTVLQSIEKYDIKQACWKTVSNMEIPTYDSAFATIRSRIYIFGGSIGNMAGVYIKDIQCFDTISNTCTKLYHNLPFTLTLGTTCCSNRDVYITCPNGKIIHYNEDSAPTVINSNKGSQLMGFATIYHENAVYIMGGYSLRGESDSVHKFDLNTKKQVNILKYKLPFTKKTNELFATSMHVSKRFLTNEAMIAEEPNKYSKSPRCPPLGMELKTK